jgi:hypothetical protein
MKRAVKAVKVIDGVKNGQYINSQDPISLLHELANDGWDIIYEDTGEIIQPEQYAEAMKPWIIPPKETN